jgi:hypothetical protein
MTAMMAIWSTSRAPAQRWLPDPAHGRAAILRSLHGGRADGWRPGANGLRWVRAALEPGRGWFDRDETRSLSGGSMDELGGAGWQIAASPFFPHADLEALVEQIRTIVFPHQSREWI